MKKDSTNYVLLPIRLLLDVGMQNLVRAFLLEDNCGVLLLLRRLVGFGRIFRIQKRFLPTLRDPQQKRI